MVSIESTEDQFIFHIKGWHQLWALQSKVNVPKSSVVNAYQDLKELNKFSGWRVGTHIPFVITAGIYYLKDKTNFWDMSRKKNTIIVKLENHQYDKLYVEVEDPQAAINLLNTK